MTTPEIRFDCPDELKFDVVQQAKAELRARHKTIDVDGVRVLFPERLGTGARVQYAAGAGDAF